MGKDVDLRPNYRARSMKHNVLPGANMVTLE